MGHLARGLTGQPDDHAFVGTKRQRAGDALAFAVEMRRQRHRSIEDAYRLRLRAKIERDDKGAFAPARGAQVGEDAAIALLRAEAPEGERGLAAPQRDETRVEREH